MTRKQFEIEYDNQYALYKKGVIAPDELDTFITNNIRKINPEERTNEEIAEELIAKHLGDGPIARIAAFALVGDWNQGFCEFTEHTELAEMLKPYACEYCNKLHKLEACNVGFVDEYRAGGTTREERKAAWNKAHPTI